MKLYVQESLIFHYFLITSYFFMCPFRCMQKLILSSKNYYVPNPSCKFILTWNRLECRSWREIPAWQIITHLLKRLFPALGELNVAGRKSKLSGNNSYFSLPTDYKYLENSTNSQGSQPDFFFFFTAIFSLLENICF